MSFTVSLVDGGASILSSVAKPAACDHFGATSTTSPGGRLAFIGRVRLDRRRDLAEALSMNPSQASEAALCMAAYDRWGETFAEHLHGDFGFVLWDERARHLLCVRDRFGVRPLFWALTANGPVVSDDLESLARIPALGSRTNSVWLMGFLTSAFDPPPADTVYATIKRVEPATVLRLQGSSATASRYWKLDIGEPLYFADERRYAEEFRSRLSASLADKLAGGTTGITLSGGLDSTSLAAMSVALLKEPSRIVTLTRAYKSLIDDDEGHYSSLVARKLGVAHTLIASDDHTYDPLWFEVTQTPVEPSDTILSQRLELPVQAQMAAMARIWLYGEGPDNALTFEWRPYFRWLARNRRYGRLGIAAAQFVATTPAREWRLALKRLSTLKPIWIEPAPPSSEDWVMPDAAKAIDYEQRCEDWYHEKREAHPWRPSAYASFTSSIWPGLLEGFDPVLTKSPIDYRHPYLDLRVLNFLLRVPPVPQSRGKRIVREAMAGLLPQEVLRRPKAPIEADVLGMLVERHPLPAFSADDPIHAYINTKKLEGLKRDADSTWALLCAHIVNHWLIQRGCA